MSSDGSDPEAYEQLPPHVSHHPRSLWARAALTALSFTLLLVGCAGGLAGYMYGHYNNRIERVEVLQPHDTNIRNIAKQLNAENFLLIGSDTREGTEESAQVEGARSDTTMLVHLSADRKKATIVSFPRDSWVEIPECDSADGQKIESRMGQFNEAFTAGGPACTIALVQKMTGIAITHYVQVDFAGFTSMVNALGTVSICSTEPVDDQFSGLRLVPGMNRLNGTQALAYVRARYSLGDGGDLGRIQRQQLFLGAVLRQAMSGQLLSNPAKLTRFLDAVTSSITIDKATSFGDLRTLAESLRGLDPAKVSMYTAPIANPDYTPPGTDLKGRVLLDEAAGRLLYDAIINDVPPGTPTPKTTSRQATSTPSATPAPAPTTSSETAEVPSGEPTTPTPSATLPTAISGADDICS